MCFVLFCFSFVARSIFECTVYLFCFRSLMNNNQHFKMIQYRTLHHIQTYDHNHDHDQFQHKTDYYSCVLCAYLHVFNVCSCTLIIYIYLLLYTPMSTFIDWIFYSSLVYSFAHVVRYWRNRQYNPLATFSLHNTNSLINLLLFGVYLLYFVFVFICLVKATDSRFSRHTH